MACSIERLINGMVYAFKNNPKTIGWVNSTSPVVDVTDVVKQVYPEVQAARLTIYGDPSKVRVLYKSQTRPPAQTVDQIVANWRRGVEIERQYCPDDGLYYLVQYPAKLEVKGQTGEGGEMWKILGIGAAVLLAMDYLGRR